MSLWEHGAVVHGWMSRQPSPDGKMADDGAPEPTQDEWDALHLNVARITQAAGHC